MRLIQIAKKLNKSTESIVAFLANQGIVVQHRPNTKLTAKELQLLISKLPEGAKLKRSSSQKAPLSPAPPAAKPKDVAATPTVTKADTAQKPTIPAAATTTQVSTPPKVSSPIVKSTPLKTVLKTPSQPVKPAPVTSPKATPPKAVPPKSVPAPSAAPPKKSPLSLPTLPGLNLIGKVKVHENESKPVSSQAPRKRISHTPFLTSSTPKASNSFPKFTKAQPTYKKSSSSKRPRRKEKTKKTIPDPTAEHAVINITSSVGVKQLAGLLQVSFDKLMQVCTDLGMPVSPHQRLEADMISLIAEELDKKINIISLDPTRSATAETENLRPRTPIVVVMGHVDHGKTSLLDYIRKTKIVQKEAGGITQHIGAYQIVTDTGQHITFLDTPGHKAFTAMRARGTKLTDISIIIIAADDGVMPQTKEAISHAKLAGTPMVFALNKIDKPAADVDKVKQQLAEMNIMVEDWGGKYQCQPISAHTGEGVDALLEKVLLEAEMLTLKANPHKPATGSVLEATLQKGRGYLVTVIVREGTLKVGDIVLAGPYFGKVKSLLSAQGTPVKTAGPATPVQILGLNGAVPAGQTFSCMASEQKARQATANYQAIIKDQTQRATHVDLVAQFKKKLEEVEIAPLNIMVKADTDGSAGALVDMITQMSSAEVPLHISSKAVGPILESDIEAAANTDAVIIGFQVKLDLQAKKAIQNKAGKVKPKLFNVIYEVADYIQEIIDYKTHPEKQQIVVGKALVLKTFEISRVGTIAGCVVQEGNIKRNAQIRILRGENILYEGEIKQLKRAKEVIKEAKAGTECGISTDKFNDFQEGDIIESVAQKEL
ncbi:MAG: translation initiation factor IF-2 [Bacteroidota bacterium]